MTSSSPPTKAWPPCTRPTSSSTSTWRTAQVLLRDIHRHIGDGAHVVIWDGAIRGVHIDQIMRRIGWIIIAPTYKLTTPDPDAPTALRAPDGKIARGIALRCGAARPGSVRGRARLPVGLAAAVRVRTELVDGGQ